MGAAVGFNKAQQNDERRPSDTVRPINSSDDCGPDEDALASHTRSPLSGCGSSPSKALSSTPAPGSTEARLLALEQQFERQCAEIRSLQEALVDVKRDGRRIVTVLQYNILASYLGANTLPWFLYGADITSEERKAVFAKYNQRDASGKPVNSWPTYAEGILTPAQIQEVTKQDAHFHWSTRKVRLVDEIRRNDADVVSLVELDQADYFKQCLGDQWDMVFHKRPRAASLDGCGVFWRRSKFQLVATHAIDFIDGCDDKGRLKRDRSGLIVLLKWRFTAAPPLAIVSTHLAKDPDDRSQTAVRVRQVTQIMEALTEFTTQHGAAEAPVVLCGDLNAKHFGEIRGIARTVWQMTGSQLHKFLWCAADVPTGPTSITKARQCRIDAVQYLPGQMEVVEVKAVPRLPAGEVIPSKEHPSDHFPVCVKFRMKDSYQTQRELGRAWLECVAGHEKVHPLTQSDLRHAFDFFDRDKSGCIHRADLEEACIDLQCGYFSSDIQQMMLDCFPESRITYTNFIKAYEVRLNHERIRSIGELECAFQYFSGGCRTIPLCQLEEAFRDITPISFTNDEVKQMIGKMGLANGTDEVDLHSFCEVVCRASFPHRDRRRFSKVQIPEEAQENMARTQSKDLRVRLEYVQQRSRSYLGSPAWPSTPNLSPHRQNRVHEEEDEASDSIITSPEHAKSTPCIIHHSPSGRVVLPVQTVE